MNPDWCSKLWCCLLAVSLATKRERGEPNFWTPPGQTVFSWELNSHFLLFGIKIFWEWHLKKKISLIFSWKQLLKVMWCITEPGSKSLLIHKSFVSIFCFVFRKQKWLNEILTKERGQIFAVISGFNEYVWDVGIIFSNYYFVFLGKKKKKCVWRKKLWRHKTIRKNFDDPPSFLTLAT